MQRLYILVVTILLMGMMVGSAVGSSSNPYGCDDMPEPPVFPEWASHYVVDWLPDDPLSDGGTWDLFYMPENIVTYVYNNRCMVDKFDMGIQYQCKIMYDEEIDLWYITGWRKMHEGAFSFGLSWEPGQLAWFDFDWLTKQGNLFMNANPIPPPPLAGKAKLETVLEMMGGVVVMVVPVGLLILSMLLLLVLIRYLLRWLSLRIKS